MLVSENAKICVTPNVNAKICVTPNANLQREQVESGVAGGPNARVWHWPCKFHVFFVLILYALCSQRNPSFQWNMGFKQKNAASGSRY